MPLPMRLSEKLSLTGNENILKVLATQRVLRTPSSIRLQLTAEEIGRGEEANAAAAR